MTRSGGGISSTSIAGNVEHAQGVDWIGRVGRLKVTDFRVVGVEVVDVDIGNVDGVGRGHIRAVSMGIANSVWDGEVDSSLLLDPGSRVGHPFGVREALTTRSAVSRTTRYKYQYTILVSGLELPDTVANTYLLLQQPF